MTKFRTKNDMHSQVVDTVACTIKLKIPDFLCPTLDVLRRDCEIVVSEMLDHREFSSTKYYTTVKSVIAKALIHKYQDNKKCKSVKNIVIPLVGDQGRQIKQVEGGLRIPAIFKKQILPFVPSYYKPIVGFIRSIEFFKRKSVWYAGVCYNTNAIKIERPTGNVGIDRNSIGHVATLADPQTGKVLHLGFNPDKAKQNIKNRKSNLQRLGKFRLLSKINKKQSRRTKNENHVVSKQIVDYAAKHRRCIVLEDLNSISKGRCRRYVQKSQWSFYQLLQFIRYKSALRGVMVLETDPAYTSQECSRCHQLNKPNNKKYVCGSCGHIDHRDANAAFNIGMRLSPICGFTSDSVSRSGALMVAPIVGTEAA